MICTCACHCCAPRWKAEPEVGTVLAFKKIFSGKTYGYVALRAGNGKWYLTAASDNHDSSPKSWPALRAFIGANPCSKVLTWEDIP
jgi:ABC-type uncharacterized transport system YnjBCD substrate-binding protein